jgi:uncharacterized membrane protein
MLHDMAGLVERETNGRRVFRIILAAFYLFVGIMHLRAPSGFLAITPDWVPYPLQMIIFTGVCEIAGAIALLTRRLRAVAGVMLALYAVCVYPANIKHAVEGIALNGTALGWWYHGPRLAFQPVFVWWALFAGGVVDWPFAKRAAGSLR